tara:strand:- start:463 stop:1392 length:930 start_codon:yes stop_codon:yes gene_type:complete
MYDLNIQSFLDFNGKQKYQTIYFDPPFNSDRNYSMGENNAIGFTDKWSDEAYEEFITKCVNKLHELLEKNGTMFFHISASCMYIPEKVIRKKFKYVEPIFWKKARSKNNVKNKLGATIDIIWKCSKVAKPKFNVVYQPKDPHYLKTGFTNKDARGNYSLGHIITEPTKVGHRYEVVLGGITYNPPTGWRIKEPELMGLIEDNRIHLPLKTGAKLYKKIYLHENPGKACTDLWDDIHSISQGSEGRKYPTAKPVKLLERIIEISSDPGDWILDPMCGSGTTARACENMGRKCTLIDVNPEVVEIVKSRFT